MSSTKLTDVLSNAKDSFEKNKGRVSYLLGIHKDKTGTGPGKRSKSVTALSMSAMVLITACWESYLETLLLETFKFLLNNHVEIPKNLKKSIGLKIMNSKDGSFAWKFIKDDWKDSLVDYVEKEINNFSSPSAKKVDKLFEKILDLSDLSKSWSWQGGNNEINKLDEFLSTRNEIAHGEINVDVGKKDAEQYLNHVEKLVGKTEEKVKSHIEELLKNQKVSE